MTTTTQSLEELAERLAVAKRRVQVARNELNRAIEEFVEVEIALRASEEG